MLIQTEQDIDQLHWQKMDVLLPAVVQDAFDRRVQILAYINPEPAGPTHENL